MKLLTVNAGSSSIRLAAYASERRLLATHHSDAAPARAQTVLREFIKQHGLDDIAVVAHRVVHGGNTLVRSCVIDAAVEREIERLSVLAPLHNPPALAWLRACRALLGARVPQVAVFDTAFYAHLPEVAATYALPRALNARLGLRRFGFHGLAHEAMWRRWCALRPDIADRGCVISLQLGAGCSITAVRDGRAVDTSMGFSPLEGLVMATRSGDVDAGLLLYLQSVEGMSPEQLGRLLNEASGLLGLSGISGDMRTLLESSDPAARLAVEAYAYRARKYIGAYLAALGGADAIVFGGGVGEHAPTVRAAALKNMEWAGVRLDAAANETTVAKAGRISRPGSKIEVWVLPVDEQQILAQEALAVISRQ
ncbi:MAG TPA: acetate/propionate family kinase [Thiobacillus sp.]|jgi:acetate kinase|nr:acetate/propionate family kinase [Thiobacillus sp.]